MNAFNSVLVGLDLSDETANLILNRACQLANSKDIELLHVCDHLHHFHEDYSDGWFANSEELDEAVIREAYNHLETVAEPFGINKCNVVGGHAAAVIHARVEQDVDLIVVGTHGRKGWRLLLGSTANAVLDGTPCNVLAVRIPEIEIGQGEPYKQLLVAVDLTDESNDLLEQSLDIASRTDASITICHVFKPIHHAYINKLTLSTRLQEAEEKAEREAEQLLAQLGCYYDIDPVHRHLRRGHPADEIHKLADELASDLIVVGSHGKLSGSTANGVLHGAKCDALAVRMK